jgi:aminopeptidase N
MPPLTRAEAAERATLIQVRSYDIDLDLTTGPDTFRSVTTIRFRAMPGTGSFVELRPHRLHAATLNGVPLDLGSLSDNRLPLAGLMVENRLVVVADMAYSNSGDAMNQYTDPADGETYVYATSFLAEAQRVFACFDQPDLKARVRLHVTCDPQWTVVANACAAQVAAGRWECAETPPLPTYLITLVAGRLYSVRQEHDGIPLGLHCRAALAAELDREAGTLFALTRGCFDRYHELFGMRYRFGKYDQVFVPEYPALAMENAGCVVLRDDALFHSAPTEVERELRAVTMAHEMAHMWFGDLVTLRWWDDLWLNEAFADYFGMRVVAEVTEFRQVWTSFAIRRKLWGYRADQRPSTHPVVPDDVGDTACALTNVDGITYAKGSAVLRQLVARLGDDAFRTGLRTYFARHEFGNATLQDLLGALADAGGQDLAAWADVWLRRAQVNTLRPVVDVAGGRYRSVSVEQTAVADHPTLRPHRLCVGRYDLVDGVAVARPPVTVDVDGPRTAVHGLADEPVPGLLLLNDGDLTFAKIRLDDVSAAAVPALLPALRDPLPRALVWGAVICAVRDAQLPPADLVTLAERALPAETEAILVETVLTSLQDLLDRYLDAPERMVATARVAEVCAKLLAALPPDDARRLPTARALIHTTSDTDLLRAWLADDTPDALLDDDLRWRVLRRLIVLGAAGPAEIETRSVADRSAIGARWAAGCRAALPDLSAKAAAWHALVEDTALSGALGHATAEGFWHPEQTELTEPYVARYFADLTTIVAARSAWVAERTAEALFPRYAAHRATRDLAGELLLRSGLDPGVRRAVADADHELGLALASRAEAPGRAGGHEALTHISP